MDPLPVSDSQEDGSALENATQVELLSLVASQKKELRDKDQEVRVLKEKLNELTNRLISLELSALSVTTTPVCSMTSITLMDSIPINPLAFREFCIFLPANVLGFSGWPRVRAESFFQHVTLTLFEKVSDSSWCCFLGKELNFMVV